MRRRSKHKRPLWPKEHGAYGQLGFPLVAALAMGRPGLASLLLVVAAVALFVAHEPLLVLLGARGLRAKRQHRTRAWRVALVCLVLAMAGGVGGLLSAGRMVALGAVAPALLLVLLLPLVITGREKTAGGELLAAGALSAAGLPVALAGGVAWPMALAAWAVWMIAFAISTAAVRLVIARHKGRREQLGWVVAAIATAAVVLLGLRSLLALAAVPMVLAAWVLILRPPHPRHLKRVGWTLVACSLVSTLVMVAIA